MYNNKQPNIHIKTFGSPGLSQLTLSRYLSEKYQKEFLVFKFVPCIGQDDTGADKFCKKTFPSTSIDHAGAKDFLQIIKPILDGKDPNTQITASLPCGKSASLNFEYKLEKDGHMGAYLTISKDGNTVPFKFETFKYKSYEDGEVITNVLQTGLSTFAKILEGYIASAGVDDQWNRVSEEERKPVQTPQPTGSNGNSGAYQGPWPPPRTW